jgi:glucosamine-6-phosphate deaminase
LVNLHHQTITDAIGDFGSEDLVPKRAITMGVGTILQAKAIVLMAWGTKKAAIVKQALHADINEHTPATFLREHANTLFVLDLEAASQL